MVMRQNGTAHDGKVCIGAQEVMREELNEIKKLYKGCSLDLHRYMLAAENDTVLIIIYIRRILEEPVCLIDL